MQQEKRDLKREKEEQIQGLGNKVDTLTADLEVATASLKGCVAQV
jgi:hypothetical protein